MFNRIIDTRSARGLKIFAGFAMFIIAIGLVMHITNGFATGYYRNRLTAGYNTSLNGKQIILLGCIMLGFDVAFYFGFSKKEQVDDSEC